MAEWAAPHSGWFPWFHSILKTEIWYFRLMRQNMFKKKAVFYSSDLTTYSESTNPIFHDFFQIGTSFVSVAFYFCYCFLFSSETTWLVKVLHSKIYLKNDKMFWIGHDITNFALDFWLMDKRSWFLSWQ